MGRLRVNRRTGSSPNIEKLSGLVRLYIYATTQSKECKKFRPVQVAPVEILRFSSTGQMFDPNDQLSRGAIYLHHCELDLRRILFGVVDGVARDDAL